MASLAACASKEEAEAQFEKLVQFVQEAIQFMPSYRSSYLCDFLKTNLHWMKKVSINLIFIFLFRLEEQTLAQCSKSDLRRVGCNINAD